MTHQNHQTNGASLEDCHTNFFALTDLCGIKWRKFANGERPNATSDPLDDPILRSYSRCMQADILCVWRRVQSTKQDNTDPNALPFEISTSRVHPPLSLAAAKELWIFWYGEEPDLSDLVDAELLKVAANQALWNGTWERGLTYECRSLLFKALHNLMERFVLTKDIVRFGKWFVQPCTSNDHLFGRSSQHLSFSFTFFVHGDTVCASIDLREHPTVRPLTKEHLSEAGAAYAAASVGTQSHEQNSPNSPAGGGELVAQSPSGNVNANGGVSGNGSGSTATTVQKPRKVILAPFGMAATLTGNSYKSTDPMAEKILEDWASFFPLCNKQNSDVPPVVEVVSGGHKMYHPSIYVLVTDLDDMEELEMEAAASLKGPLSNSSSTIAVALAALSAANTTTASITNNNTSSSNNNNSSTVASDANALKSTENKSATIDKTASSNIALIERLTDHTKVQSYYDTLASSFTCNTTNTHAPPQAATEMPERAWQDCIMNAEHVAAHMCASATGTHTAIYSHNDEEGTNPNHSQTEGNNGNNSNGSNNNATLDIKPKIHQLQQQQQVWGFVDPTEKAPCICTKYQTSNKKSSTSAISTNTMGLATTGANAVTLASTCSSTSVRLSGNFSVGMGKPHSPLQSTNSSSIYGNNYNSSSSSSNNNNNNNNNFNLHHHNYRPATPTSNHCLISLDNSISRLARSNRTPFHKRPEISLTTIVNNSTNAKYNNSMCEYGVNESTDTTKAMAKAIAMATATATATFTFNSTSNFNTNASTSVSAAFGGTFYKTTSDTIPKQRPFTAAAATATPHGTPHGGASTYSRNSIGDSMPVPSVGSPSTPAPSPHPNSSLSQPTSVPPADQLLNMSPRAPTSVSNLQQPPTPIDHLLDKNTPAPTPTDQHDNKSITASPYVNPAPSVEPPPSAEGLHSGNGGVHGPGSVPQASNVGRCTPTMTQLNASIVAQPQPQLQPQQQQQQQHQSQQPQQQQCGTISVKKFDSLAPLESYIKLEPGCPELSNSCNRNSSGSTGSTGSAGSLLVTPAGAAATSGSAASEMNNFVKLYKLPKLSIKDPDSFANDDCLRLEALYDFTAQDAWANHPMKRFKPNEVVKPRRIQVRTKNLYDGHTHFKPPMPSPGSMCGSQLLSMNAVTNTNCSGISGAELECDGETVSGGLVGIIALNNNMNTGGDGVESSNTGVFYSELDVKSEVISSPCKENKPSVDGNLFTAEGLKIPPNLDMMEDLFERSSSNNNECSSVQIHTPPDSNNPSNGCGGTAPTNSIEELKRSTTVPPSMVGVAAIAALQNCTNSNTNAANPTANSLSSGANSIQAEDLTKMFPTPPSHEQHHPNSSPCQMDIQMTDLSVVTSTTLTTTTALEATVLGSGAVLKLKQEYSVELGSPVEEPIEDWSYVYRPPQRAKFVGSSKYAPLTNLPSQSLPPLIMPANSVYKPSRSKQQSRVVANQQQQHQQLHQLHQQQQQQLQQHHQQHQQLQELLSAAPRTPLQHQQPRTPLPSPMHSSGGNTVPTPLSSGGGGANNLLLHQLNGPQAALTNTPGSGGPSMQQLMQRAGMSPISPVPAVPFPRGSPMLQAQRQTPIHPPPPYEMAVASPATSTSSYLNKPYNSQEPPQTPQSVGGAGGGSAAAGGLMSATQSGGMHSSNPRLSANAICSAATVATRALPEVSSLIVNILLYDTALNVFRDHNFDSSTVCVCNADTQKVGNIRGADSGVYVPLPGNSFNPLPTANCAAAPTVASVTANGVTNMRLLSAYVNSGVNGPGCGSAVNSPVSLSGAGSGHLVGGGGGGSSSSASTTPATGSQQQQHISGYVDDDPVDCTCGFSAVVNRRLAYRAGLFYEDEMEITGNAVDPGRYKKQSLVSFVSSLATVLRTSASAPPASGSANNISEKASVTQAIAEKQAHDIFDLLIEQCSIIQTSSSAIHRALQRHRRRMAQKRQPQSVAVIANVVEFIDANDIVCLALEQARMAFEGGGSRLDMSDFASQHQLSPFQSSGITTSLGRQAPAALLGGTVAASAVRMQLTVHKWPFIPVGYTRSNKDIVSTMNAIQPMLQNAFHSKSRSAAGAKDATYTVSGPLTWRQFHRLAGRASGQCEPQPIPSVVVGHDKDWISVAPLSIHYWDKILLEPYSYARDIAYLIVCPANEHVVAQTRTYFKELSSTYELCKLGRHTPMRGWDGLLKIGGNGAQTVGSTLLDDWLRTLTDTTLAEQLRLYAHAFQHLLAPYLSRIPGDKTLLHPPEHSSIGGMVHGSGRERTNTSSPLTSGGGASSLLHNTSGSAATESEKAHTPSNIKVEGGVTAAAENVINSSESNAIDPKADIKPDIKPSLLLSDPLGMGDTLEEINPSAIVLYVVEPFTFGSDSPELERLACIALLRCYAELLQSIPESVRANIHIQLISLESILELGRSRLRKRFSDELKCLALNIFSQCRRHLLHAQTVKSLTGFGTAAHMEQFLKSKDEKNRQPYRLYTPPYILAPIHEKTDKTDFSRSTAGLRGLNEPKHAVLYCNYCLSEDQCWLLATVTDDRGELLEKVCINIDVPNRSRRRKAPARRVGLKKLMDYIMGLISQTAQAWRIVIGRIGRIGHSELKSWSYLLSKPNLMKASKQLKDICKQCTLTNPPSILSACLVTLEPDAKLRVMPDQFTPDERFSQISMQNPLSTPQDVTCTHILVFPTSAVCLSFTRQFQNEPQVDLDNDFLNFEDNDEDNEGFSNADLMGDLLGDWEPQMGPMSNHGSPDRMEDNRSWQSAGGNNFNSAQQQDVEEVGSINQQPLAVGYMVSTAPTGRMPSWFWAACPHLEDVCPVFLKTALHLHVPNIQTTDDILNSTNAHSSANDHPLDSTLTADVLRYVLEGYNALSWLALDSNTHDRLSCLPINVQTLMDLYYLTAAIA